MKRVRKANLPAADENIWNEVTDKMDYYCNPINVEYRYQLFKLRPEKDNLCEIHREAADPSVILFKGKYYLFPSMSAGFFTSNDLCNWQFHEYLSDMPVYDYAPDVRAIGEYLYFSASASAKECSFFRTKDPETEPFEEIKGTFPFWDPNLFQDDDGKMYFYWGCSNIEPIYGVELDPDTMKPIGEKKVMIEARPDIYGYERTGEDHVPPKTEQEVEMTIKEMLKRAPEGCEPDEQMIKQLRGWFGTDPYVEGAWMTKHRGKYYLQYATPGTEYNVYADAVYVGDLPLGPFAPVKNNPYSYKPGGFITGAGHGSTLEDKDGNFWHMSTMRISKHHSFERRLGLWKAGFDQDGELYCDQRYGDWPIALKKKAWEKPDWMLLSYGKSVKVSSGSSAENITDEDVRTWWKADSDKLDEWVEVDLGKSMDVRAVQINFADEFEIMADSKTEFFFNQKEYRAIDMDKQATRWILEGSEDGNSYSVLKDKSVVDTDLSHDLIVWEEGKHIRYLKLTAIQLPYKQPPCISGIRVFGNGVGEPPKRTENVKTVFQDDDPMNAMDAYVAWESSGAVGYNIIWGYEEHKLYHSYLIYGRKNQKIGALVKGEPVYIRVDAFNENGITEGVVQKIR